jgi:hypothetical protein
MPITFPEVPRKEKEEPPLSTQPELPLEGSEESGK